MSTKSTHFNTTAKTSAVTGTSPWKLLGTLIAPYKGLAVLTLLTLLCDIVGMLYIPTELSALINAAVTNHDMVALTSHGIRMFMAALLGSGGCIVSYWLASRLAARIGRDLRTAVYKHSLEFSGSDFNRFGTGSMITRTLSDANVVQQTFLMCFTMMFPVPVTCIVSVVLAFSTDTAMGWILLAVIAVSLIVSAIAVKISAPIFVVMQNFIDGINARLRESITGVRVIRAFGKETYERARMTKAFEDYASRAIRVNLIFAITDCTTFFLMNAVESLVMWAGANRVGIHAMQIGSISALIEYAMLIMFFMMMAQFAMLEIPRALTCLERSAAVLDQKPTIADGLSKTVSFGQTDEVARFDHASLRFDDADEDTLQDLCFSLKRGQTTAIIGNTGSGKSTIAKMLLRFSDVTGGRLTFGDADIRDLPQAELRSHIAYVPQKAWLFSGTIAENLRFGYEHADDACLWHAIDVAQGAFVRELKDGLDTPVAQGGTNFSGGQRQRLAIARSLTRHADLYIFDDSFSALDYKTDAALRHALKDELAHAAVLIVAQRVSTIRSADQIIVLSDGCIVGLGTHDELMRTCQTYKDISDSQTRGGEQNV
ncbi:ABC transporter ATP-binding protein [Lancefieldella rimae]|uniref:ABC transporter ATP-binding protein n=1 Tax=Lancefieldella rimae TaxID=1383 RepID=UPI0028E7EC46|nr:ABC transporter ATP-binding protein [Lancefieldella rimae]